MYFEPSPSQISLIEHKRSAKRLSNLTYKEFYLLEYLRELASILTLVYLFHDFQLHAAPLFAGSGNATACICHADQ